MKWNIHLLFAITLCVQLLADGIDYADYRTNSKMMQGLVTRPQQSLQEFSAVIYDGRKEIGYGIVISEDGGVIAKWSELDAVKEISVRIGNKKYDNVLFVRGEKTWDVCLLKVDAINLKTAVFAENSKLDIGSFVVANGATSRSERKPIIGIISAQSREIPAEGGAVLGVEIIEEKNAIVAGNVPEVSGAYQAGIRNKDHIVMLNDKLMKKRDDLVDFMKDRKVGEKIEVTYKRGGKTNKVIVELQGRADTFGREMSRNDSMSGDFSQRRSGFPRVLQHDCICDSKTIGGPLLDLDGKCVGMTIAYDIRGESYAIPVEELREISQRLLNEAKSK